LNSIFTSDFWFRWKLTFRWKWNTRSFRDDNKFNDIEIDRKFPCEANLKLQKDVCFTKQRLRYLDYFSVDDNEIKLDHRWIREDLEEEREEKEERE
jgi:hypothetical protein